MAVPKRRKTRSRRDMRRSHDSLQAPTFSLDKKTGELYRPHFMLPNGTYRGHTIKFVKSSKEHAQ